MAQNLLTGKRDAFGSRNLANNMEWNAKRSCQRGKLSFRACFRRTSPLPRLPPRPPGGRRTRLTGAVSLHIHERRCAGGGFRARSSGDSGIVEGGPGQRCSAVSRMTELHNRRERVGSLHRGRRHRNDGDQSRPRTYRGVSSAPVPFGFPSSSADPLAHRMTPSFRCRCCARR